MAKRKETKPSKRITAKTIQQSESLPPLSSDVLIPVAAEPDNGPWDHEGLNARRLRFVSAYVGAAGGNASTAAEMAGYRADNRRCLHATSSRLLNDPNVSRAIAKRLAFQLASLDVDAIRSSIGRIARADLSNFITVDEDGTPRLDFLKARDAAAIGQLREFKAEGIFDPAETKMSGLRPFKVSIKAHDPKPAIELLAKMAGLLKEQIEHSGSVKFFPITLDGDKQANTEE